MQYLYNKQNFYAIILDVFSIFSSNVSSLKSLWNKTEYFSSINYCFRCWKISKIFMRGYSTKLETKPLKSQTQTVEYSYDEIIDNL